MSHGHPREVGQVTVGLYAASWIPSSDLASRAPGGFSTGGTTEAKVAPVEGPLAWQLAGVRCLWLEVSQTWLLTRGLGCDTGSTSCSDLLAEFLSCACSAFTHSFLK